eukprot:4205378-Heterocapsa_arctica.AAC.1
MSWPSEVLHEEVRVVLLGGTALHLDLPVAHLILKPKIAYGKMLHAAHAPPGRHRPGGRGVAIDPQTRRLPELVQDVLDELAFLDRCRHCDQLGFRA